MDCCKDYWKIAAYVDLQYKKHEGIVSIYWIKNPLQAT